MVLRLVVKERAIERGIDNISLLQRKAGLTYPQVKGLWFGTTSNVSLPALNAIARILQVDPRELFTVIEVEELAS